MDVVLSAFGLVVLSPLFLVVAVAIKLDSPGPVFFRQTRMGATGARSRSASSGRWSRTPRSERPSSGT